MDRATAYQHPTIVAIKQLWPGATIEDIRPKGSTNVIDAKPQRRHAFAEGFEAHLNEAMEMAAMEREERDYLGGSRLGVECERALFYEFSRTPKDEGRNFKGRTLRIFDMGHDAETRMAAYLQLAGFKLLTHDAHGHQFGFGVAKDKETGKPRIAGHIDGVNTDGPLIIAEQRMSYPHLWENKGLGAKSWNDVWNKGLLKSKPVYFVQMQSYMAYLGLHAHPGLFTAINRDTGAIYAERIEFDVRVAQLASDKGVRVISAREAADLPRIAVEKSDYRCGMCDWRERCWTPTQTASAAPAPTWFAKAPA